MFLLDFQQPYRVPVGAVVTPPIKITVKDKVLKDAVYHLEATGIVRVEPSSRGLVGLQRGTADVRVIYPTGTGAPDTVFQVQVVVSQVTIDPPGRTVTRLQDSVRLSASAQDAHGTVLLDAQLRWSTSDTSVATVSQTGVVRAVDEGWVAITADVDGVEGRAGVTVVQVASAVSLAPELDTLRTVKGVTDFIALAFDSTGQIIQTAKPRWASSDPAVATVDASGRATATGPGVALIIAGVGSAADTGTLVVAQVLRYLFASPPIDTLIAIDDTARVLASATDSSTAPIPNPSVTWKSSDNTIVTVDQGGLVRALRNGAAVITASSGGQSAFATVVVRQQAATVRLTDDALALSDYGDAARLSAEAFDRNAYGVDVDASALVWRSRLNLVATVDSSGLVTAWGDGTTGIVVSLADSAGSPSDTAIVTVTGAPQQPLIAFASARGIELMRVDGSLRTPLLETVCSSGGGRPADGLGGCHLGKGWVPSGPAWSPDGTRLAFTLSFASLVDDAAYWSRIYVARADGSDTVNLSKNEFAGDQWPAWSPDGTKMAFGREGSIYVMNADGSNVTLVVRAGTGGTDNWLRFPTWSPDGTRLAFDDLSYIYVVAANGAGLVRITVGGVPAWSPDGSRIAYIRSMTGGGDRIWLMNPDGSGAINLTKDVPTSGDGAHAWSPDGSQIVFAGADANGLKELYTINRDGTGLRRLTTTSGDSEEYPSWRVAAPLQALPSNQRGFPSLR